MGMQSDDPIELYAAPEIFVDGFTKHESRDGVMSCNGYRRVHGRNVVVVKLVWPVVNTSAAIDEALQAMSPTDGAVKPSGGRKRGIH